MTRTWLPAALAVAATTSLGLLPSVTATAAVRAAAPGSTWSTAQEIPGTAALNQGGNADVEAMSCPAAGNCAAAGDYIAGTGVDEQMQLFTASETGGVWRTATELPGIAALHVGGIVAVNSLSCPSPGNCAAGGYYGGAVAERQPFVVSETNGTWGSAEPVPGIVPVNLDAQVDSVSCAAAGNCTAIGNSEKASGAGQAFTLSETDGVWGKAEQLPGIAALNGHGDVEWDPVSCTSAGNCVTAGSFSSISGISHTFIDTQANGTWGMAEQLPGITALNKSGQGWITSLSCPSAGNCSAGGGYVRDSGRYQAFVASEKDGTWRTVEEVPGFTPLDTGRAGEVDSLSCASAGNCSAGGGYTGGEGAGAQMFVVNEENGIWRRAEAVPGLAALGLGGQLYSIACGAPGDCAAGGRYEDSASHYQAFLVTETNGVWGTAQEVPGTAALNEGGNGSVSSVSCGAAGNCSAGGLYEDGSGHFQAFVTREPSGG